MHIACDAVISFYAEHGEHVLPGDFERGRGDLWQVNFAGHSRGWIWQILMARLLGGSSWRVHLAGQFGTFIWRVHE